MGRLTHTVSGSIATVRSPAVAPIESLKVHFSPVQEGTGDPSPSNVRPITGWTGVTGTKVRSIWDGRYEKGYINASGQIVSNNDTFVNAGYIDIIPNSKIKFRFTRTNISAANIHLFYYNENKEYITDRWIGPNGDINISANTRYIRFQMDTAYSATYDGKDLSVYYSDEAETIPVTFPAVGKNLFDKNSTPFQTGKYISDVISGVPQYTTNSNYNVYKIPIKSSTTYTFGPIKGGNGAIWGTMQKAQNIMSRYEFNNGGNEGTTHTFTSYSGDGYLLLSVAINGAYKCDDILQLEEGSSATTYEAFDNTMYGGYVDLATGDVYKEYKRIVYDGSEDENWGKLTSGSATAFGMYMSASDKEKALYSDISSNYLKTISHNATWGNYDNWISDNVSEIATGIQSITTVSAWKEYLLEHNLVVCYKLKTPLKIATLTPQELATFKGYSNFWSNAGDVDVTYQVVESSEMTKERQKIFAGNAPTIHTTSGSVANFNMEPGLNRNLKSCKVGFLPVQEGSGDPFPPINQNGSIVGVNNLHNESELSSFKIHFSPIQSGSGDPSPTNVRPITGWTGVTGYKGGKNLLNAVSSNIVPFIDSNFSNYTLNDGNIIMTNATLMGFKVKCKPSTKYTYSLSSSIDLFIEIGSFTEEPTIFSNNSTFIVNATASKSVTFTTRSDTEWIVCIIYAPSNLIDTSATASNFQLEVGATATSYEAYSAPTSYPVSWESQGTVYGGYVDFVSGDVVATMLYKKQRVGDSYVDATYENTKRIDVLLDNDCLSKANGTTSNTISSYFTYAYNNLDNPHFYLTDPNRIRCFVPIDIDDNTEIEFICTLLNPIVVATLTPTQIALDTGKSSYWSNTDAVTVETVGNVRPIKGWGKINTIRCGKNLYPFPTSSAGPYAYWVNGSYPGFDTSEVSSITEKALNNESVTFSTYFDSTNSNGNNRTAVKIWARDKDDSAWSILGVEGNDIIAGTSGRSSKNITFGDHASITFGMSMAIGAVGSNPMVEYGSSLSDYEPYNGNIYPITFPVQGKNLLDVSNMTHGSYNIGSIPNILEPNTTYTFSVNGDTSKMYRLYAVMENYNTGAGYGISLNSSYVNKTSNLSFRTFTTPANIKDYPYLALAGNDSSAGNVSINDIKPQVELGSTATSYEPYDNSILGGYVNLVTGEVWKTYNSVDLGTLTWTLNSYNGFYWFYSSAIDLMKTISTTSQLGNIICDRFDNVEAADIYWGRIGNDVIGQDSQVKKVRVVAQEYNNDTNAFKLGMNGILLYYELETPQPVTTLTPTQIQALKGTNNILSDANGIIEVKYWSH